jgi:micrococcal nuclease
MHPAPTPPPETQVSNFTQRQTLDSYATPATAYTVLTVIDGDTIKIADRNGKPATIRLIGIDTPETVHPTKSAECLGKEASAEMRRLVSGNSVYLKTDATRDTRDKYGRHLRYVYVENGKGNHIDVNAAMIRNGFAYAYTHFPFEKKQEYITYQKRAATEKVGLWADGACMNPLAPPIPYH